MEKIIRELGNEISGLQKQKGEVIEIEAKMRQLQDEMKAKKAEMDEIPDKKSGFYTDLAEEFKEKDSEFKNVYIERERKRGALNKEFSEKKNDVLNKLGKKLRFVDENRNINMEVDLEALKKEKEKIEEEIKLNDTPKEEFLKMEPSDQRRVKKAKENYLNNKHRLGEISPQIDAIEAMDGKSPKDRYLEISQMIKIIDEKFTLEKIDDFKKRIDKVNENKEEETSQEENDGKQEDIEEDISQGDTTKKEDNQFKQTDTVNGFRVTTTSSPIATTPENINKEPKESKGIENIIISERNGNAIIAFKNGEKSTSNIGEIFENKKNIYGKANIKEICKNIAGDKIRGLLLSAKVNPAIVDLLQNYSEPEMMQEYIQCLNDKKELPFELVHDLRDSKLGIMNRLKMWVCARAEDKIPGTKITFVTRLWNKNKAMAEKSQVPAQDESSKTEKLNEYSKKLGDREDIKVDNQNNKIETKAQEKMQEEKVQETIGKNVDQIMNEENIQ